MKLNNPENFIAEPKIPTIDLSSLRPITKSISEFNLKETNKFSFPRAANHKKNTSKLKSINEAGYSSSSNSDSESETKSLSLEQKKKLLKFRRKELMKLKVKNVLSVVDNMPMSPFIKKRRNSIIK
jgi:ribosomal protein L29